jgi:hypothetical protein
LIENTFGHYLDLWLKIKSNSVAAPSYRGYANKAGVHVRPRWGTIQIDQIDHLDLHTYTDTVPAPEDGAYEWEHDPAALWYLD